MLIPQLSIFVQDKVGRVGEICALLAARQVNIAGFDIADTTEGFGILHLVVDRTDLALKALQEQHLVVKNVPVICVRLENRPGQLAPGAGTPVPGQAQHPIHVPRLGQQHVHRHGPERRGRVPALGDADFRMLHVHDLVPGAE